MISSNDRPTVALLSRTLGPFRRRFIFIIIIVVLDNLLASLGIAMIFPIIQTMLQPIPERLWVVAHFPSFAEASPQMRLIIVTLLTILIFVLKFIIGLIRVVSVRDLSERLRKLWTENIGRHILYGSYQHFISQNQGVWLSNWLTEPMCAGRFFLNYIQYLSNSLMVIGLFLLGMAVNWKVMVGFVVVISTITLINRRFTYPAATDHSRNKSRVIQQLSSNISESLGQIKDIKVLNAEERRLAELGLYLDRLRGLFVRAELVGELPRLSGELLAILSLAVSILIMTAIPNLSMSEVLPTLALFFILLYRLLTAVTAATAARIKAWQEYHSVKQVDALTANKHFEESLGCPIKSVTTDIVFKNVSFAYDVDRPVLKNLNVVLRRGAYIKIIGGSGAGKTTLLDLLLRIVRPREGEIKANGRSIETFSLYDWRGRFGYVGQEVALLFGTIRSNIINDCHDLSAADLDEVCRLAGCYDFIHSLPEGYDTSVGQNGYALSGGQRKRIAIARALVGDKQFLILDEATTTFEASIEHGIIKELRAKRPSLTIILVSHRQSDLSISDMIVKIDGGHAHVEYR